MTCCAAVPSAEVTSSTMRPSALSISSGSVGATGNVFLTGHRLRLEVSSSNFPRYDRNPNTGAPFATDVRTVVARQTVFHDAAKPSRLILPVIPR